MRNTAASQARSLKIASRCSFNVCTISGHCNKQRLPFLLSLSEFCINQILGRSYFSLRKGDLFSLVSLQTMVEREAADKNLGDDKNMGWFIALHCTMLCLVSLLCLGDEQVISLFSIHVDTLVNLGG